MNEITTHTKTATIRVIGDNTKFKLFGMFDCVTAISGQVKDKIHALKGDETHGQIYQEYIKAMSRGRGCATTVIGSTRKERAEYKENSFARHKAGGIFPFYSAPTKGFDLRTASYTYTVNAGIHTQLDSLEECDALVKEEYNRLKTKVEELEKTILDEVESIDIPTYYEWIETVKALGWSYNAEFYNFFTQKMLPALKSNAEWTVTYKIGDKNKRYKFYNPAVIDEIKNHPERWDALANHSVLEYYKAKLKFNKAKDEAQYTHTTLMKAPVRVLYANNGVKFAISSDDDYAYMTFALPGKDGQKPEEVQVKCGYRKYNHLGQKRKSCYLHGLSVQETETKGVYLCKYSINGIRPQEAYLKECFLRLKINNQDWFQKYIDGTLTAADGPLEASCFDFYFDLCMGVVESPIHNLTADEVLGKKSLRSFYSTAYPEVKDLGNQSTVDTTFACPIDKPHRLMGVDLGIRNPFAYCIKDNNGNEIARGHLDGCQDDYYKVYKTFTAKTECFVQMMKETKNFLYGDDEAFDEENLKTLGINKNDYVAYLTPKRSLVVVGNEAETKTYTMRYDDTWVAKDVLFAIVKEFKALKNRRMTDSDWRRAIYWVESINGIINAQKAFHNFGSYYDKSKGRVNGTGKGFAYNYYEQLNGVNEDMFKKFGNELVKVVKQYGVSILVLENMDALRGNSDKSTIENQIYNMWPVGKVKTFLEGMLTPCNVGIVDVSEQNTSQVYKGQWIDRNGDNLYLNGKFLDVHADENAAENIVNRALCHHTDLYSLYMVNPVDDYWVPKTIWSPKEGGSKQVRGCLTKLYGSSNVVLLKKNGLLVKSDMSIKDLKKMVKSKSAKGFPARRVNGNQWRLIEPSM